MPKLITGEKKFEDVHDKPYEFIARTHDKAGPGTPAVFKTNLALCNEEEDSQSKSKNRKIKPYIMTLSLKDRIRVDRLAGSRVPEGGMGKVHLEQLAMK